MGNKSEFDLTLLRLPKGLTGRTYTAFAMGVGKGKHVSNDEWSSAKLDDDAVADVLESLKVERVEVTRVQRESLAKEDETLLAVDTVFFNRPAAVSKPVEIGSSVSEPQAAWGLEAIGLNKNPFHTGQDVTIAILDTGIDKDYETHPAFRDQRIVPKNFTSEDENDWQDTDGHGTHCAGTIFGNPVNGTKIGIATGIDKALVGKVLGAHGGSTDGIYKGLLWAALNRADIISMSLAIDFDQIRERHLSRGRSEREATSLTLKSYRENFQLFDSLSQLFVSGGSKVKHPLVVVATGNESSRPDYTIEAAPPAVASWFLSVNAVDENNVVADFSNTGGKISAPGVHVLSAALGGGLRLDSGTSMAAPHVAGAAALWIESLQRLDKIEPKELLRNMMDNAIPVADSSKSDYGAGLVQVPA